MTTQRQNYEISVRADTEQAEESFDDLASSVEQVGGEGRESTRRFGELGAASDRTTGSLLRTGLAAGIVGSALGFVSGQAISAFANLGQGSEALLSLSTGIFDVVAGLNELTGFSDRLNRLGDDLTSVGESLSRLEFSGGPTQRYGQGVRQLPGVIPQEGFFSRLPQIQAFNAIRNVVQGDPVNIPLLPFTDPLRISTRPGGRPTSAAPQTINFYGPVYDDSGFEGRVREIVRREIGTPSSQSLTGV